MTTIQYQVEKNSLTSPPSYFARVSPRSILDIDDVAKAINSHNPTIPVQTAKSVIEKFAEEVGIQLANGNTVKISSFCSWVVTLGGRMDNPTDPLPSGAFDVIAKPSAPFKSSVAANATYERIGYAAKTPSIVSVMDTNTGIQNYVREGYGLEINGTQMAWSQEDAAQGVYLLSSAGNDMRQTNIVSSTPSKAFIIPELDSNAGPAGAASVEQILSIATRYTENGEVRVGTFKTKLRTTNAISDTNKKIFIIDDQTSSGATISAYTGSQVDARLLATIGGDGVLKLSVGTLAGVFGDPVSVAANGSYVLSGLASDVTVTVATYATLYANVVSYGKYMQEVLDLSPLTP